MTLRRRLGWETTSRWIQRFSRPTVRAQRCPWSRLSHSSATARASNLLQSMTSLIPSARSFRSSKMHWTPMKQPTPASSITPSSLAPWTAWTVTDPRTCSIFVILARPYSLTEKWISSPWWTALSTATNPPPWKSWPLLDGLMILHPLHRLNYQSAPWPVRLPSPEPNTSPIKLFNLSPWEDRQVYQASRSLIGVRPVQVIPDLPLDLQARTHPLPCHTWSERKMKNKWTCSLPTQNSFIYTTMLR